MAYIRKIKGSLVRQDSTEYVGEESYLFYDIDTGCIRRSDGTPGGAQIGLNGCFGTGGGAGAPTFTDTIPASGTVVIDSVDTATHNGIKWIYTLINSTTQETMSAEVMANHKFEIEARWTVYGIVGDLIQHGVNVVIEGTPKVMALKITNNQSSPITINAVRIQMVS